MDTKSGSQPCFQKGPDQKCDTGLSISAFIKRNNPTTGSLVMETVPPYGESSSHKETEEIKILCSENFTR